MDLTPRRVALASPPLLLRRRIHHLPVHDAHHGRARVKRPALNVTWWALDLVSRLYKQSPTWARCAPEAKLHPFRSSRTCHTWNVKPEGRQPWLRPWKTGHFAFGNAAQGPLQRLSLESSSYPASRGVPRGDAIQTDPGRRIFTGPGWQHPMAPIEGHPTLRRQASTSAPLGFMQLAP